MFFPHVLCLILVALKNSLPAHARIEPLPQQASIRDGADFGQDGGHKLFSFSRHNKNDCLRGASQWGNGCPEHPVVAPHGCAERINLFFLVIVYGDLQFETGSSELLENLRECTFTTREEDLDELRSLLIRAGEFEQALEDAEAPEAAAVSRKITDAAAAAFFQAWMKHQPGMQRKSAGVRANLNELRSLLSEASIFSDEPVTVKIPEGFAFYALFPEQYCCAASAWSDCNQKALKDRNVLVIGIRSIGTTLSALVCATLASAGWQTKRITVRPKGPPFERVTKLPDHVRGWANRALVVDEGPGISGSSMASVAKALVQNGFIPEQVSFLPGHGGEPGSAASDDVREWWKRISRYVTPWENLRWDGMTLAESLQKKTSELAGKKTAFATIEDASCGRWRQKIYNDESLWPWVPISFERMKFFCANGHGGSILWKFAGLRETFLKKGRISGDEFAPQPLARFRGFVALPWIAGELLDIAEGENPEVIRCIAQHIIEASKAPLSAPQQAAAFKRLREMLFCNIKEALGSELAARAKNFAKKCCRHESCPAYGDGRLAPHEWVRTQSGKIMKVGGFGHHDADHTIIGRQPLYWDAAGVLVEWQSASMQPLLSAFSEAGVCLELDILSFYRMSYAAFRMGQAAICAGAWSFDKSEVARTQSAFELYRGQLRDCLTGEPSGIQAKHSALRLS